MLLPRLIFAACLAWAVCLCAPWFVRSLVRYRASLLHQGPDADRLREEWTSVLRELDLRWEQLWFALGLFWNFHKLQIEIEFRAGNKGDLDSLVEQRVLNEIDHARAQLGEEDRARREEIARCRRELEDKERHNLEELHAEREALARVRAQLEKTGVVSPEAMKELRACDPVRKLVHSLISRLLETNPFPQDPETTNALVRALEQYIADFAGSNSYDTIHQSQRSDEYYELSYGYDDRFIRQDSTSRDPFPHAGIRLFLAGDNSEVYALANGNILECTVKTRQYLDYRNPGLTSAHDWTETTRSGREYSIEDFVSKLSHSQKVRLLFTMAENRRWMFEPWQPIEPHFQARKNQTPVASVRVPDFFQF